MKPSVQGESSECDILESPKQAINKTKILGENLSLRQLLFNFNVEIISKALPDTLEEERLLRPSMLEALLHHRPTSKAQFFEVIPAYLRTGTNTKEGKYLDEVLEIIADYN